jgi:hypothetical protein
MDKRSGGGHGGGWEWLQAGKARVGMDKVGGGGDMWG